MKKGIRRLVALTLVLTLVVPMTACSNSKDKNEKAKSVSYGEVWSAPSSVKIMQDEVFEEKGSAELTYQAVKNEYENCQLFITAKEDVKSFELEKADLKNGNEVLSADNIEVYVQKYGYYNDTTCGTGMAPDCLLPMEAASEYKENVIEAGNNGGFWVTVYIPKETTAGTYEGTFTLTIDGDKGKDTLDVPVSVEVFDYTLTDEVHADTLFSWRYHKVGTGELDASMEMMTAYYEFFLDYRISLQSLPLETLTGEELVENILKYYDRISTYTIGTVVGSLAYNLHEKPEVLQEEILAIAAACTSDRNLFDKAVMYPIDEPNWLDEATRNRIVMILTTVSQYLQDCVDIIKADETGAYAELKQIENWEESILDIPMIIPNGRDQTKWLVENENTEEGKALLSAMNCYCPGFDGGIWDLYASLFELAERNDIELWWYGCVGSIQPLPTYFIGDDNILSARTVSWMQKKYNIVGNLYWDAAGYTLNEWSAQEGYNPDLFEWNDVDGSGVLQTGDGTMCYPGASYGVYGPLPSIRMMSIRDGMEEYELLLDVETALRGDTSLISMGTSVEDIMELLFYKSLYYNELDMYADGEKGFDFSALRNSLLQFAAGFEKGLVLIPLSTEINDATGTMTYYVAEGIEVLVNGEKQEPLEGLRYQTSINLEENTHMTAVVSNADGEKYEYVIYIGEPKYVLNDFSDRSVLDGIQVSEGSVAEFAETEDYSTDGTAVHVKIQGVWTENDLTNATFVPEISMASSLLGEYKLAGLGELSMDVYNPGESFKMKVRLYSGNSYVDVMDATVQSGKNVLNVALSDLTFEKMDKVDRIVFEFQNAEDLSCEFYLDYMQGKK